MDKVKQNNFYVNMYILLGCIAETGYNVLHEL